MTTGRLTSISSHYSSTSKTFTYNYLSGTDLVERIATGSRVPATNARLTGRITAISKTPWRRLGITQTVVPTVYGYDLEGRRLAENVSSAMTSKFSSSYSNGFQMSWTYKDRGEVFQNKVRQLDSSGNPTGSWITPWERTWSWDDFSNREYESRYYWWLNTDYTPNTLNQYWIDNRNLGESPLAYDYDGNLTDDTTWDYTYDGEDRVVEMTATGVSLVFTYDYLGRRARKVHQEGAPLVPTNTFTDWL